jgi:hypothetical protein
MLEGKYEVLRGQFLLGGLKICLEAHAKCEVIATVDVLIREILTMKCGSMQGT